jgi:hypothetical protein
MQNTISEPARTHNEMPVPYAHFTSASQLEVTKNILKTYLEVLTKFVEFEI